MPILTQDIKLLKSAVMADTTDGGGQMTGLEVIDGQSNNLLPDTSAMDRAFGRVQARKLFGAAHTADTDTLQGAHAIITDAPSDPLVHCCLLQTSGWADTRAAAKDAIEKYLVKGPKASVKIYDTHYSGSLQLRLITFTGGTFPGAGDAVVLRNPTGVEQYVRILKITMSSATLSLTENGTVANYTASIGTCDLGSELTIDVLGPPAQRVYPASGEGSEASYAMLYTTNVAGGAKFYGVKPLGADGAVGELSVVTEGGIYTPIVPAATIETAIVDQYPMGDRLGVTPSGYATVTLPVVTKAIGPNAVLTAPTPISPNSVSLLAGDTEFTDNGAGALLQGASTVGTVTYATGVITFSAASPSYGTVIVTLAYKPGVSVPATPRSSSFAVTLANQGLAYTNVFEPPPATGTFQLEYMAQGRWYALADNGNGKLAGGDSSYGTGTINYATGSMSVTLGAIPDVGSKLLASWGDAGTVRPASLDTLPLKFTSTLTLSGMHDFSGGALAWSNGATNYSASINSVGLISGDAVGQVSGTGGTGSALSFTPSVFPEGAVTVTARRIPLATESSAYTVVSVPLHTYTLTGAGADAITPGSFRATITVVRPAGTTGLGIVFVPVTDRGGKLYMKASDYDGPVDIEVGTINYATGAVQFYDSTEQPLWISTWVANTVGGGSVWWTFGRYQTTLESGTVQFGDMGTPTYAFGDADASVTETAVSPGAWTAWVPNYGAVAFQDTAVLGVGSELYTVQAGTLRQGWNMAAGTPTVSDAGSTTSGGQITLTSLPANHVNAITWYNMVQNTGDARTSGGIFRTASTPLKTGVFQLQSDAHVGSGNDAGTLSGDFAGTVDYTRGLVQWTGPTIEPSTLSYNAVYLQYLPLNAALLGLETARLPLDGKVPIYRRGDLVVVHNTLSLSLPNPLTKGVDYDLGRERIASVRVKDATGVLVPDTLYSTDLDGGTLSVLAGANITAYIQPLTVEHRIEDMLLCSQVDISGQLKFTRSLTHDFPAGTSFVSSAMPFGDLFARSYNYIEQATWTAIWSDNLIGSVIIPQFNDTLHPIAVTNAGAIKERWVMIFTNTTAFRVIGESVGEIGTGNTSTDCAPVNPATGVPYFALPALGWGNGWAAGNCLRFNTDACGTPFWVVRTVLQGPASIDSDQFTLAFRGDVDRP